jgi:hypothetical protein
VLAKAGVAVFTGLSLTTTGSGYALEASAGGATPAATTSMSVTPGVATRLVITAGPPASTTAGSGFGITVKAEDHFGNVDSTFQGTVTLALASNPGKTTLHGTVSVPASAGVAVFSGVSINTAAIGYTLRATSGHLIAATSGGITITPGVATHLVYSSQPPASDTAGVALGVTIKAVDAFGNLDTGFNGTIGLALGSSGVLLHGPVGVTASGGVAVIRGLTINQAAIGYTLTSTFGNFTPTTSIGLSVKAAAATRLAFTVEPPASVQANHGLGVTVKALDVFGNVDSKFNGSITLALSTNPGQGKLGGKITVKAVNGVAVFTGLSVNTTGSGYALRASSGKLKTDTSLAFDVTT